MKSILSVILLTALSVRAFAGALVDKANIFGPQSAEVNAALADKPVWIETAVTTPPEGLKEYADQEVQRVTNHGFVVVITTQPRAWRISMNPIGLASSEATRLAGTDMVALFKQRRFTEGAEQLANELTNLTVAHVEEPVRYDQTSEVLPKKSHSDIYWLIGLTTLAVAFTILALVWSAKKRHLEEQEAERESERRRQERELRQMKTENERLTKETPEAFQTMRAEAESDPSAQVRAQQFYSKYTPAEREQVIPRYINHPVYSRSILDDPIGFYLFMNMMERPVYPYYYGTPTPMNAPAPEPQTPPEQSRSSHRKNYSSDSSGSSSSSGFYDSSSSSDSSGSFGSFDSGGSSSSDSSGASGSW